MNLYHDSIGTNSKGSSGQGGNHPAHTTGMAWIHHYRKVAFFFQVRNHAQIQGVASIWIEGSNSSLAQYHLVISRCHDVFSRHQQFFYSVGQTTLQENGFITTTQLLQKVKVLHIAGTNLNHIHIIEQVQLSNGHELCYYRQACFLLCCQQQVNTLTSQALETVGACSWLKGPTTQEAGTRSLYRLGNSHQLLLAFNGTRTSNNSHRPISNYSRSYTTLIFSHPHDRILGMKGSAGPLVGSLNPYNLVYHRMYGQTFALHLRSVTYQAQNSMIHTMGNMNVKSQVLQMSNKILFCLFLCIWLQNYNHLFILLISMIRVTIPQNLSFCFSIAPKTKKSPFRDF